MERSQSETQAKTANMLLKQIARFALVAPLSMGCLMADEVGDQDDCCLFYGGQGDPLNPCAFPA